MHTKLVNYSTEVSFIVSIVRDTNEMEYQRIKIHKIFEEFDKDQKSKNTKIEEVVSHIVKENMTRFETHVNEDTVMLVLEIESQLTPFKILQFKNSDGNQWKIQEDKTILVNLPNAPDMWSSVLIDTDVVIFYAFYHDPAIKLVRINKLKLSHGFDQRVEFYEDYINYLPAGAYTTLLEKIDCEFSEF
jgi:hypothetical protein